MTQQTLRQYIFYQSAFDEDLKAIIEASPFSEEFTVQPPDGGEPFAIRGIFDESVLVVDGRSTARPVPRIMLNEAPDYESGRTEVVVRGRTFRAQKHETDAATGCVLWLA